MNNRKANEVERLGYRSVNNSLTNDMKRLPFYIKYIEFTDKPTSSLEKISQYSDHLIYYQISGACQITSRNYMRKLKENDIFFQSCVSPIRIVQTDKPNCKAFLAVIGGDSVKLYYNLMRSNTNIFRSSPLSDIPSIVRKLIELSATGDTRSSVLASVAINNLLGQMYEMHYSVLVSKAKSPVKEKEVSCAIDYMRQNYADRSLNIDRICAEVCLSKCYFCQIFKEQTGRTINSYLNQYRIYKSKELLAHSRMTIDSISSAVGFSTLLTFLRNFKKEENMTPREYREGYR